MPKHVPKEQWPAEMKDELWWENMLPTDWFKTLTFNLFNQVLPFSRHLDFLGFYELSLFVKDEISDVVIICYTDYV